DLRGYSWRLSHQETLFLQCLLRLRREMVANIPFINSVEAAKQQSQDVTSALFDETWIVKGII
ncbi:hypothetical protein A2U01_0086650, partial [Trifolium medium]|nr:hypothetical protein [Trifolium medium]